MFSQNLSEFSALIPQKSDKLEVSNLIKIGSYLYSMLSSIYTHQFRDSESLIQEDQSHSSISPSDLLFDDQIELSHRGNSTFESPPMFKNSSFSTLQTIETLLPNNSMDQSLDSNSMISEDAFMEQLKNEENSVFEEKFNSCLINNESDETIDLERKFPSMGKSIYKLKNKFACKYCLHVSDTKQQLGGHVSRKHPGKGTNYHKKQMILKNKEFERIKDCVLRKSFSAGKLFSMI